MPVMPRPEGRAKKIAFNILGGEHLMKRKHSNAPSYNENMKEDLRSYAAQSSFEEIANNGRFNRGAMGGNYV